MPTTYNKIATVTVGSGGAATIDFQNIPATYTDLCLKVSLRDTFSGTGDYALISVNGSSTSGKYLNGNGSSTSSGAAAIVEYPGAGATSSTFGNGELYFSNYTSSNNKSFSIDSVTENNGTTAYADLSAGLWSNTAVITRITITPGNTATFVQYSTATLYGIKNS